MYFTAKNRRNAEMIPAMNNLRDDKDSAEIPVSIHARWNVKQGRQLKGFLSSLWLNRGRTRDNIFPK